MTTRCLAFISSLAILALAAAPVPAQQPGSAPAKSSSCLIRIRFPGPTPTLDCDALTYIVNSSGVFDAALKSVSKRSEPRSQHSYARLDCTASRHVGDAAEIEAKLFLYLGESEAATADENAVLEAVLANLRTKLSNQNDGEHRRLADLRMSALKRAEDHAKAREALRSEQAQLLQQSGAPVSPLELERFLITTQEKRRELELTMVGQRARQEAISVAIAELNARVQERAANDPVVSEMKQLIEIRERIQERVRARAGSGAASTEDVDRAIEGVTLARAELARARAAAAMNAGGDQLARLNADLTQVSIDAAEIRARVDLLSKQTEELRSGPAMKNAVEYDRLAARLRDVESVQDAANAQVAHFEQQASQLQAPTLTVIGQ